jgi:predicted cytidylate kinase
MSKNKITLSGFAGTGKSTIGKILQEKLDYEFISIGNFSRNFAEKEYGLTINQFQEKCKNEPELDKKIDEHFMKYCDSKTKIVVDYRLGFKFVNNAFNVLLKVSDEVAASRIQLANRKNEDTDINSIKERNNQMKQRFLYIYNVDFTEEKNYHLVIDTDELLPENIADLIIQQFKVYGIN